MAEQLVLPTARRSDPETSHAAARRVAPKAQRDRDRVLAVLRVGGPMTDFEIAAALRGQQTSLGVRRGELVKAGLVEWAGTHRPSPSGSPARVWRVTGA